MVDMVKGAQRTTRADAWCRRIGGNFLKFQFPLSIRVQFVNELDLSSFLLSFFSSKVLFHYFSSLQVPLNKEIK